MFDDPEVIELLSTRFVPTGRRGGSVPDRGEQGEDEFIQKVAEPFKRGKPGSYALPTGHYVLTVEGERLGYVYGFKAEAVKTMLRSALGRFSPGPAARLEKPKAGGAPPEGAVFVSVASKVLGGWEPPKNGTERTFQESIGWHYLVVLQEDLPRLARGEVSDGLRNRFALRLVDLGRGEGVQLWAPDHVRRNDLAVGAGGRLSGSVSLEDKPGRRGFRGEVLGFVEFKAGKLSRFDAVVKGLYWNLDDYTRNPNYPHYTAPQGKYPMAFACKLVPPEEAKRVPPEYLNPATRKWPALSSKARPRRRGTLGRRTLR